MKRILSLLICVSVILSASFFVMPVYASNEEALIDYIWFDDFSGETISDRYTDNNKVKINTLTNMYTLENGALKFTSPAQTYYYFVDDHTISDKTKKLVVSYKFKISNKSSQFGTDKNLYATALVKMIGAEIYTAQGGVKVTNFTPNTWVTVTCVLDNQSTNRDVYINNAYFGPYDKSAYQPDTYTYYNASGKFRFSNAQYVTAGGTLELDDYMIYYLPSELKYELESASASEVKLNFNMIPDQATVIPQNFTVKEGNTTITPATATISAEDPRQVVLTFSDDLTPGTSYTVSAKNVKAGSSEKDIADTLELKSNPELSFSVAIPPVEWTVTNEMFSFDYETNPAGTTVTADVSTFGFDNAGVGGIYTVETVDGKKSVSMKQNSTAQTGNGTILRYKVDKNLFIADKYAFEMKVKTDFSKNPDNAMFDTMVHSGWGLPFTSLYDGGIYKDTNHTDMIGTYSTVGTYSDGEWVTLKNVYYSSPVNIEGTNCLRRDIYVNGQFVETVYDSWDTYQKFITGKDDCWITFRVRDISDDAINTEGKAYIDYFRVYTPQSDFAAKLGKAQDVDTSYINAEFNNIPVDADLTSEIYIADENGVKVSDIAVSEFINEFNADGYAAKINLWFANELELDTTYKLCIHGVSDIAGNKLYQEETFTTKSAPEAEGLTISDGIASVTVNECSEPLTLYVVGYNFIDGAEQMTTVDKIEITTAGDHSTKEPVTGSIVKAFLWKGTKPVIQFVTGGTN